MASFGENGEVEKAVSNNNLAADDQPAADAAVDAGAMDDESEGVQIGKEDNKLSRSAQSKASLGTSNYSAGTGANSAIREVSETFSFIAYEMKWTLLATFSNSILLWLVSTLASEEGMRLALNAGVVKAAAGVVVEILLLVANIFTVIAMDTGAAAFFGYWLGRPHGTSLVVCGFVQSSSIAKWSFANELSLNSTVRKVLSRLSVAWIIVEALKLLTPIAATGMSAQTRREDSGTVSCVEFGQNGSPANRLWPTVDVEAGFAEYVYGTSLGILRSEMPVNYTRFVMSPQLIGAVNDGDTLVGAGFITDLYTTCGCSKANSASDLVDGGVDASYSTTLMNHASLHGNDPGMSSYYELESSTGSIIITSVFYNYPVCGGYKTINRPICKTNLTNHIHATIQMQYGTDGTTASIAQQFSYIREELGPADVDTWLLAAVKSFIETQPAVRHLPPSVPGMINPLMYWTSSDLLAINPSLMEAGIETYYTMLLRVGIQRTFSTRGNSCVRNADVSDESIVNMKDYAYKCAVAGLAIQLILSVFASIAFVPWLLAENPLGPVVRVVTDNEYFTTFIRGSTIASNLDGLSNAPKHAIWQCLDIVVRVGESIATRDDTIGVLTLDKPKLVRGLTNGKKYM